jgi:hypothetical protein
LRILFSPFWIGLSDGNIAHDYDNANFYAYANDHLSYPYFPTTTDIFLLSGTRHQIESPNGEIRPKWNDYGCGDVFGCGLLLNSKNELSIFFTVNGTLIGQSSTNSFYKREKNFFSRMGLFLPAFVNDICSRPEFISRD